jgi:uncharacterized protein YdaU (DUF1376 family)
MRYYKHNIGDFLADTHFLPNDELSVYVKLVWQYYLQEKPFSWKDDDYHWELKSEEFGTDYKILHKILHRYFQEEVDPQDEKIVIWRHKRIDIELAKMNSTNLKKKEGIESRWNNDTKINGFEEFWKAYPNKKDKQKAIKAWAKHQPDLSKVLKALKAQKNSEQWKKDNGQYIPLPTTWLNGARWEDEVTTKKSNSTYL